MGSLEEGACTAGARTFGFRCEVEFRPDRLAGRQATRDAPAVGECVDQEEAQAGAGCRQAVGAGVRHLDAEGVGDDVEEQAEVPAGGSAVCRRVGRQLRDDLPRRVQRQSPGAQLLGGEEAGQAGAARGGGELEAEVADGGAEFGGVLLHVTQRGCPRLP